MFVRCCLIMILKSVKYLFVVASSYFHVSLYMCFVWMYSTMCASIYVNWWSYYKYILYHVSKRFFIALHWSGLMDLLNVALSQLLYCIMSVYKWHDMLMMKCSRDLLQTLWNLNEERFKFELWCFFNVSCQEQCRLL